MKTDYRNPYQETPKVAGAAPVQYETSYNRGFERGYIEGELYALNVLRTGRPGRPYHELASELSAVLAKHEMAVAYRITALLEVAWGLMLTVTDNRPSRPPTKNG